MYYLVLKSPHSHRVALGISDFSVLKMPHYSHLLSKWLSFTLVSLEGLENYFHIYLLAARRSTQSFLKEVNLEYSLEGLMLKLQWPPEEPIHWKRPWCWERLKAGGEGDDRGLDGWMASLTQWTWLCASSGRWWRTGKPGVLQSVGLQRVGHNWATEKQNTCFIPYIFFMGNQPVFQAMGSGFVQKILTLDWSDYLQFARIHTWFLLVLWIKQLLCWLHIIFP